MTKIDKWLLAILIVVMFLILCLKNSYGAGVETIKDDNDGNQGWILINTGKQNGKSDVGHWTDIKNVPELKGDTGATGTQGIPGKQGIQGIQGEIGKGLKNRQELQVEIIVKETKRTAWSFYYIYDTNNQINTIGAKCTIRLGKSYIEKKLEELEKRLEKNENFN